MQHVCSQPELFTTMSEPPTRIAVKGIAGSSTAEGVGSVRFSIVDSNDNEHTIDLENVIYLPNAAKNLISTSQILSRGTYSIFLWGNDRFSKVINHHPGCAIPLLAVNERVDAFTLFTDKHEHKFEQYDAPLNPTHTRVRFDDEWNSGQQPESS